MHEKYGEDLAHVLPVYKSAESSRVAACANPEGFAHLPEAGFTGREGVGYR